MVFYIGRRNVCSSTLMSFSMRIMLFPKKSSEKCRNLEWFPSSVRQKQPMDWNLCVLLIKSDRLNHSINSDQKRCTHQEQQPGTKQSKISNQPKQGFTWLCQKTSVVHGLVLTVFACSPFYGCFILLFVCIRLFISRDFGHCLPVCQPALLWAVWNGLRPWEIWVPNWPCRAGMYRKSESGIGLAGKHGRRDRSRINVGQCGRKWHPPPDIIIRCRIRTRGGGGTNVNQRRCASIKHPPPSPKSRKICPTIPVTLYLITILL